jgi:hypothetical protein
MKIPRTSYPSYWLIPGKGWVIETSISTSIKVPSVATGVPQMSNERFEAGLFTKPTTLAVKPTFLLGTASTVWFATSM